MSQFWLHLHGLIGTKLKMSSSYHLQTDGVTKRMNRMITQMLRRCVNDEQIEVSKFPMIEFAINSAWSGTTRFFPFFPNTGQRPCLPLNPKPQGATPACQEDVPKVCQTLQDNKGL